MAALDSERRPRPQHRKRETLTRRISFPTFHLSPDQLALVRRWIVSFALVDFDVDTGPNLDNAYPPARLPAATRANVAFSSMPEAVGLPHPEQLPDGGYAYHWRVPYPGEDDLARLDPEVVDDGEDEDGARLLRLPEGEGADGALHGFVWFVRDKVRRLCLVLTTCARRRADLALLARRTSAYGEGTRSGRSCSYVGSFLLGISVARST